MSEKPKWTRVVFMIGIVVFLTGTIDPLEGSFFVVPGSVMMALSAFKSDDIHWKIYTIAAAMIIAGVTAMFYISSLGGIGENSVLSIWYGLLILPYPLGWLLNIVFLLIRAFRKKK